MRLTEFPENDYRAYLEHHGIPGMRWGVRRYQNADGSLTTAGKLRAAKADRRARDRKIQDEVWKKEEEIESKYKRGQKMSNEDVRKELAADAKASKDREASQQRYRSEVKSIKSEARAAKAQAKAAKRREKILNNPKLLKKHLNEYSDKEINDALKRFDQIQRLEGASRNRSKAGKVKKALAATVGTGALIVSGYNTAKNLYKIKKDIFG